MLEKYTLLRGIDTPSRLTKKEQTGASYEITHLEQGLLGRSVSLASEFGAPPFCFAGFCIFHPDFTKISSISALDEDTGKGKKYLYLFSNRLPVKQVEMELKKLKHLQSQDRVLRHHGSEGTTSQHGELVYDLEKKDISAIYFCEEESFQNAATFPKTIYDILLDLKEWRAITSRIQAIYIQRDYYLVHQVQLDLFEYSTSQTQAFRQQAPFCEEEIIQLWLDLLNAFIPVIATEDPCLFLNLSIDEIKNYAVNGVLIKNCLPADSNYDTTLKQQLQHKLAFLINTKKEELIGTTLDEKEIRDFEEELSDSLEKLQDKIQKTSPTLNMDDALFKTNAILFKKTRRLYSYVTCFRQEKQTLLYTALSNLIRAAVIENSYPHPSDIQPLRLKGLFESAYFLNPMDLILILNVLFQEKKLEGAHILDFYHLVCTLKEDQADLLLSVLKTNCQAILLNLTEELLYGDAALFFNASLYLGISKEKVSEAVSVVMLRDVLHIKQFAQLLPYLQLEEKGNPKKHSKGVTLTEIYKSYLVALVKSLFFGHWKHFNNYRKSIEDYFKSSNYLGYSNLATLLNGSLKDKLITDADEIIKYDTDSNRRPPRLKRSIWASFYKSANSVPYESLKKTFPLFTQNNPEFGPLPLKAFKLLLIIGIRILLQNNGQMSRYLKKIASLSLPNQVESFLDKILTRTLDYFPNAIFDKTIQQGLLALHPEFKTLIHQRVVLQQSRKIDLDKKMNPVPSTENIMPLAQKALIFAYENYLIKRYSNEKGQTYFPILYKQEATLVVAPTRHYEAFIEGQDGPFVYRSNHGLAHTARTLYLLLPVIQFNLKTMNPELKRILCAQMNSIEKKTKFITKLQIALAFYVTGREGEHGFGSEEYQNYRENSALNFWQYIESEHLTHELFEDEQELSLYVDCLANPYYQGCLYQDLKQENEKLKKAICIKILLYSAHCADLARLWGPSKIRTETVFDLMKGSYLASNSDEQEAFLIFHEASRLCHAMGDAVGVTYDTAKNQCSHPKMGFSNAYDTRYPKTNLETFFAFSLDPMACIEFLNTGQYSVPKTDNPSPQQPESTSLRFFARNSSSFEKDEPLVSYKI